MSKRIVVGSKPKDQKKTLRRLLSYLGKNRSLMLMIVIASVVSTLGGLYTSYAISPLINTLQKGITGDVTYAMMMKELVTSLTFLAIVVAVEIAAMLFSDRMMVKVSQRTVEMIRKDMFDHIMKMKVANIYFLLLLSEFFSSLFFIIFTKPF